MGNTAGRIRAVKRLFDRFVMWLKDKRRGYTDADIDSLRKKYKEYKPTIGGMISVNKQELKAMIGEGINYYDA